jgi:hypothetical protein
MRLLAGDPLWCHARALAGGRDITTADRRMVTDNVGWVAGDEIQAQFAFKDGLNATFTSSAKLRPTVGHWGIEIHGSKAVARLNCDIAPHVFLRTAGPWSPAGRTDVWEPLDPASTKPADEHTTGPVNDWLDAVRNDREPACSGRNGAWAVEMVAAVYASALAGRRAAFPLANRNHPLEG